MHHSIKASTVCAIAICFNLSVQSTYGLRILGLFPLQVKSHFVMCEELMRGLANKGYHVDVYSHFPLKEAIKNYHDYSLVGSLPSLVNNISYEYVANMKSHEMSMKYWFENSQEIICDLIGCSQFQRLLRNPPRDPPYDLIITELSIVHCYIPFGQHLNVPMIAIVSTPLCDYQYDGFGATKDLAAQTSMYTPYGKSMSFFDRLDNYLNYQRAVRNYNKYTRPQEKYVKKYFGSGFPRTIDLPKYVSLVLVNQDASIDGVESFVPKIIPVAGLHIVDHKEALPKVIQQWLDDSVAGCVYFSFGSMIRIETFPKDKLVALYKSFENIKPVRVLMKVVKPEELPAGVPSNVLTQPWLSQIAVLQHKNIKAFVTHGGLMGTQEAIFYGVPMVGVPLVGDEFLNIMKCVVKNVSFKVELSDITEESFTHALNEILNNPLYRESMQLLSKRFRHRPMTPLNTAIFWVEYIHLHGKNALNLPTDDMPWWQASLLDVYAFIAGSISIVLYVCIILARKLKDLCLRNSNVNVESRTKTKKH